MDVTSFNNNKKKKIHAAEPGDGRVAGAYKKPYHGENGAYEAANGQSHAARGFQTGEEAVKQLESMVRQYQQRHSRQLAARRCHR